MGALAPVLLVTLRVLQGIAVGGEWGGSMLVALEHAPSKRRGFAASVANMGGPAGALAATSLFGLFATLPREDFYSWGWRIPFLLSVVLVVIELFVRLKLAETPFFERAAQSADERRTPVRDVLTQHRRSLVLGVLAGIAPAVTQGVFVVWSTSFVVQYGMSDAAAVSLHVPTAIGLVAAIALSSTLSDRFGRRPVMIAGMLTGIVLAWPLLRLLQTGTIAGVLVAIFIAQFVIQGFAFGPLAAFCAELFPTRVRYTGAGLVFSLASTLGAGFTPMLATAVWNNTNSVFVLAVSLMVVYAISATAVLSSSEGTRVSLDADDSPPVARVS